MLKAPGWSGGFACTIALGELGGSFDVGVSFEPATGTVGRQFRAVGYNRGVEPSCQLRGDFTFAVPLDVIRDRVFG